MLLVALWPLVRGPNAREAEAWGLRLTGPERIERLAHGDRRRGLRHPYAGRWRALVWDSEDDVVADLEALGWTLIERRPPSYHVTVVVFSKPHAEVGPGQWGPSRPSGPVKRLLARLLAKRLGRPEIANGTWPHDP